MPEIRESWPLNVEDGHSPRVTTERPAAPAWMRSRLYRIWVLGLFAAVATFGFVDRIVVQVLVQPIKAELHVSDADMGLLGGLTFAVLYVALSIPIARLAERKNRVAIITIGTTLWSIATAASGIAVNFSQLLLARIGVGIGEAAGTPATTSIVSDYFPPQRRGSAMSVVGLAVPLGAFLGGSAGGYIALHWGWRAAFLCAGLPGLALALLQGLTVREPLRGHYDARRAEHGMERSTPSFRAVLRRFWERRSLIQLLVGATLSTIAGYGINYFLAAYMFRRFGLDYAQAGLVVGVVSSLPAALSIIAGGFVADWAGRRSARWYALIPALGAALAAPLYIASFQASTWLVAAVLLSVTAVCQYAYIPAAAAVTQNMMEPRMRASAAAVTGLVYTLLGQGLGPLFVGMLSDHFTRTTASASHGLQIALTLAALVYVWSAVHLVIAARGLTRDLSRA
jgi:MFS family permease